MRFVLNFAALIMLMVAVWFLYTGFSIETTVPSTSSSDFLPAGAAGVANLQLMHLQLLNVVIGLVAGLAACVLWAGACIVGAINHAARVEHSSL